MDKAENFDPICEPNLAEKKTLQTVGQGLLLSSNSFAAKKTQETPNKCWMHNTRLVFQQAIQLDVFEKWNDEMLERKFRSKAKYVPIFLNS